MITRLQIERTLRRSRPLSIDPTDFLSFYVGLEVSPIGLSFKSPSNAPKSPDDPATLAVLAGETPDGLDI
jgi:hypothetical protein